MINSLKLLQAIFILVTGSFTVLQYNIRGLSGKSSEFYNYIVSLEGTPQTYLFAGDLTGKSG